MKRFSLLILVMTWKSTFGDEPSLQAVLSQKGLQKGETRYIVEALHVYINGGLSILSSIQGRVPGPFCYVFPPGAPVSTHNVI